MAAPTEKATIGVPVKSGNGVAVPIQFLDGTMETLFFALPITEEEIVAAIRLRVADKNRILEAVDSFQNLIGREIT